MKTTSLLPALLIVLTFTPGCFYSREISRTRQEVQRQFPEATFRREIVISMGPVTMHTLSWIAGLAPDRDAQMVSRYLNDLKSVKVGVYEVRNLRSAASMDLSNMSRLQNEGWELAVKSRDRQDQVWLLYREHRGEIRDMMVLTLGEDELVVVRLRGRLSRLFERAVNDEHLTRDLGRGEF